MSSQAFFFFEPLPSGLNTPLPTAPCTTPSPSAVARGWMKMLGNQRENQNPACSGSMARAWKGLQQISGIEKTLCNHFLPFACWLHEFSKRLWPELYGNQMIWYMRGIKDNWFRVSIHLFPVAQERGFPSPHVLGIQKGFII